VGLEGVVAMEMVIFEEHKALVLEALEEGEFDYIEAASEVVETDFFKFIQAKGILAKLGASYPSPRKKEEVPLWFYVASNLSMRLHGVHSFYGYPLVVRAGGMLNAFGPGRGRKVTHPDTGDITLACEGFNNKNHYDRQTPCDQDFLRKVAKDTDAEALMQWFATEVVQELRRQRAFDKEGIFIGDGSYLFVPDNPHYEGSVRLRFDEHNHPLSQKDYDAMTDGEKSRCTWRRCYKMVSLLHTNRKLEFFLFVAVKIISGKDHESPVLYELVKHFVEVVGKGVMKRLILDRGFLDGQQIATCKRQYGIDVLIPVRRRMDIYEDAKALFQLPEVQWLPYEPPVEEDKAPVRPRPKSIIQRERTRKQTLKKLAEDTAPSPPEKTVLRREVASIEEFRIWSSCTVPLTVVANRDWYADGHAETWFLIDTQEKGDPRQARGDYHLRTSIEERHRHLKCFSDLTKFTSRRFSMVVGQVVFIMLAYNLLQLYLLRTHHKELTSKTPPRIRQELLPSDNHIIVYWQNYYGLFSPLELVRIIATLNDEARKKVAEKTQRLRRELTDTMKNPRAP
jgi:hypothetical protein